MLQQLIDFCAQEVGITLDPQANIAAQQLFDEANRMEVESANEREREHRESAEDLHSEAVVCLVLSRLLLIIERKTAPCA